MATDLHTFIDIFNTEFDVNEEKVALNKIIIPIIQRDYAQGRIDADTDRIRARFLDSLYCAMTEQPITLDFVYGDLDAEGIMTPLDGQQRLTTLFLLHWYVAKKEMIAKEQYDFLHNFTYETRYSARDFCECLVDFAPSFSELLSDEIVDQTWFPLDWRKDSTIHSMLVMLDAIADKFSAIEDMWEKLNDGAIQFYFLPIKDMGLTDDLYIKMNSRGKPLTQFEHFKAEFENELHKIDDTLAKRIMQKIDIDWTDMLWKYRGDDELIDDEFLRYFRFVCDIIFYKAERTTQGKSVNEFDLLNEHFASNVANAKDNVELLEQYFDCWCNITEYTSPSALFEHFVSLEHEPGKIKIDSKVDIFADCLSNYADVLGNGNRTFPLNRIILLYTFVTYLIHVDEVTEEQFARRLRIVHNLIRNSEDEISDSEQRSAGNRMPAILRQVDSIIMNGVLNSEESNNFNNYQLEEESIKLIWSEKNQDYAEALFRLEDHDLLRGQIAIIGLEQPELFDKFADLFNCEWDLIDCAMMSLGDYVQCERNGWRYQAGSYHIEKAWIELFHKSSNQGFEDTKEVLCDLLNYADSFNDDVLRGIISEYIVASENESVYEWTYYYVKYSSFRPGRYGKYSWYDLENGCYNMHVLWTESKWSENSYDPFLYEVNPNWISRDDLGEFLIVDDEYIECTNDAFIFRDLKSEIETKRLEIARNDEGVDVEDRVQKLREYLNI